MTKSNGSVVAAGRDAAQDILDELLLKLVPYHYADTGSRDRFLADMLADGYMFRVGRYVIGIAEIDAQKDEQ